MDAITRCLTPGRHNNLRTMHIFWLYFWNISFEDLGDTFCWIHIRTKRQRDITWWRHQIFRWPCVRGIQRSPVSFPHKVQWRGALIFSLICAWTNSLANNRDTGDLRRHCAHYDVTAKTLGDSSWHSNSSACHFQQVWMLSGYKRWFKINIALC